MTTMQIVGLIGKAGSGKDTAAQHLSVALSARGKRVRVMAFADPIRQALLALGVPAAHAFERHLKEQPIEGWGGKSYRELAQTLGTEWARHMHGEDFWIRRLAERLVNLGTKGDLPDVLIITDVRMQNEADWIVCRKGLLVDVQRPGLAAVRTHSSEAAVRGDRVVLHNDSDLVGLKHRCGELSNVVLAHLSLSGSFATVGGMPWG